ncbi:MAG: hypothetical protein EOM54_02360 [Clostridia bacterium]|nr:hypothetical protein [Clostridia bacterium]
MQSISDEYLLLFNALTDAEAELMNLRNRLMNVQRSAEELFIGAETYADSADELPEEEVLINL